MTAYGVRRVRGGGDEGGRGRLPDEAVLDGRAAAPGAAPRGRQRAAEASRRGSSPGSRPTLSPRAPRCSAVLAAARRVAPTDATVLLLGESGTGKEVAARPSTSSARRRRAARRSQLRGPAGDAARERAVRPRARRLHRRDAARAGLIERGPRRHAVPRRDRRDDAPTQVKLLRFLQERRDRPGRRHARSGRWTCG